MKPPLAVHSSEVGASTYICIFVMNSLDWASDIDNQGSVQQEVYFYMNSGHEQSEKRRRLSESFSLTFF